MIIKKINKKKAKKQSIYRKEAKRKRNIIWKRQRKDKEIKRQIDRKIDRQKIDRKRERVCDIKKKQEIDKNIDIIKKVIR